MRFMLITQKIAKIRIWTSWVTFLDKMLQILQNFNVPGHGEVSNAA